MQFGEHLSYILRRSHEVLPIARITCIEIKIFMEHLWLRWHEIEENVLTNIIVLVDSEERYWSSKIIEGLLDNQTQFTFTLQYTIVDELLICLGKPFKCLQA